MDEFKLPTPKPWPPPEAVSVADHGTLRLVGAADYSRSYTRGGLPGDPVPKSTVRYMHMSDADKIDSLLRKAILFGRVYSIQEYARPQYLGPIVVFYALQWEQVLARAQALGVPQECLVPNILQPLPEYEVIPPTIKPPPGGPKVVGVEAYWDYAENVAVPEARGLLLGLVSSSTAAVSFNGHPPVSIPARFIQGGISWTNS